MNSEDAKGAKAFEARPPFALGGIGFVQDADGDDVLWCGSFGECLARYKATAMDADPHFICPHCGRLALRMEEAPPGACGLS